MLSAALLTVFGTTLALGATLPARAPGLWRSVTTVLGPDGKPLPNVSDILTFSCVDPATDHRFFVSGARACSSFAITGAGSHYSITGSCTQQGKPVHIQESLVYASAHSVTLRALLQTSIGPMQVTSQLQWQGECPAGVLPGDEGSMAGGVFHKTDNIDSPNTP